MKNLAFHSLLIFMKDDYVLLILTTLHIFLKKGWESVLFELGSERVERAIYMCMFFVCVGVSF